MAAAYELAQKGIKATIIDKGDIGAGCSYGNAGWLTPCFAMPLPMPGMLFKSAKWLLNPESPLYIKPEPSLLLLRWLTHFLFAMNQKQAETAVKALVGISNYSLQAYKDLDRKFQGQTQLHERGLLMVGQSDEGVDAALTEMNLVAEHGVPGRQMSPEEIRQFEPALTGSLKGGVYFPTEAHAEPLAIVKTLAKAAQELGAQFLPFHEAFHFNIEAGKIKSVYTTQGLIEADTVVLATGSWSESIAKQIGLNIPILGGKGYALIVKPFDPAPKTPIMLVEKKIAVTPRENTVRLAGTLELVNQDFGVTTRRVRAIINGAREFMNVPAEPKIEEIWRGLRPCTPDGVPVIDFAPKINNLLIAAGHQMLGLQSAPGSGRLVADLVTRSSHTFDPHPFRATRYT